MSMKNKVLLIFATCATLFLSACIDEDINVATKHLYALQIEIPFSEKVISMKVIAFNSKTDQEYTFEENLTDNNGSSISSTNISEPSSIVTDNNKLLILYLPTGEYTITALIETENANLTQRLDNIGVYGERINEPLTLTPIPIQSSDIIFKEIYYSMCKTKAKQQYIRDQFFEIYNNSDKVQYLDNCVLARHQGSGSAVIPCRWVDDNGEILMTYPTDSYIAAFIGDGSGKSFPLEPGKSVVVAFEARNHVTKKNPNSVDLSGANYEVNISNYNTDYVNSAEVPDLTIITKSGSPTTVYSFWMLPYSGTAAILAKFDDDIDLKNYVNDNTNWMTIPHQTASNIEYFMIPQKYVLDGVNIVGVDPTKQQSQLRAEIDAGTVTNSEIYNGKSIKRKVKETINGRVVYQDTNNSSDDFLTDQTPTPGVDANGKVINK